MANIKIGDLVTLTDPVSTDVLPIVDVSADTTNKISIADMLKNATTGSASNPSFAFDGDSNTGMYRSGTDALGFSTGGTGRLFIDSSGNLGIGTASPNKPLHIYSGSSDSEIRLQTNSGTEQNSYITLRESSGDLDFYTVASGTNMKFHTVNTERMRIDSSGNLGIAVVPKAWELNQFFALQIGKGGAIYGRAAGDEDRNGFVSNCYHSASGWQYIASSAHATRYDQNDGNHIWYYAGTGTADASVSFSEAMRIDSSGLVGIGTTSPSGSLHVDADSGVDGPIFDSGGSNNANHALLVRDSSNSQLLRVNNNGNVGIGTSSPNNQLHLVGSSASNYLRIDGSTGYRAFLGVESGAAVIYAQDNSGGNAPITFNTGSSERMQINSSGDVLIGTTSILTQTAELRVYSSAACAQELVGSAGTYTCYSSGANSTSAVARGFIGTANQLVTSGSVNDLAIRAQNELSFSSGGPTERMRIDNSGNVGIGESNPSYLLDVKYQTGRFFQLQYGRPYAQYDDNALIDTLTLRNTGCTANGHGSRIHFIVGSNSSSNSSFIAAQQDSSAGNTNLVFGVNGTEVMRITKDARVGIGASSPAADLHVQSSTSTLTKFENTSATTVYLRFQNTDNARGYVGYEGKRLVFYADNGSNTADKRVAFMDADGLKFNSDTAQVNALNDYEEGTFVPTINRETTSPTVAYNWQTGKYTKIGNTVFIYFDMEINSNSGGSGRYFMDDLPFDSATDNTSGGYGAPQFRDSNAFNNDANIYSSSSYHYLDRIYLRYMDMASTNNENDITVGTGRITGWSMYFTDS